MRTTTPRNLAEIAKFIISPQCKSIVILTGAGISVSSGIPDFRSPGGMYDTLRPDLITATPHQRQLMEKDPTYVVEKQMFMSNPFPYLEVRRPFILGTRDKKWKATLSHRFMELIQMKLKDKLTRVYTQNIDGLDHQCSNIPKDKIVNVHGTLSQAACEDCGEEYDFDEFCNQVQSCIKDIYGCNDDDDQASAPPPPSESTYIKCKKCGRATVKPKTILFGSNLPIEFFSNVEKDVPNADLLVIAGTSLVVSPANSIAYNVNSDCLRLVVNNEPVGQELGIQYRYDSDGAGLCGRDYFAKGTCDEIFLELAKELNWVDELKRNSHLLPQASADLL